MVGAGNSGPRKLDCQPLSFCLFSSGNACCLCPLLSTCPKKAPAYHFRADTGKVRLRLQWMLFSPFTSRSIRIKCIAHCMATQMIDREVILLLPMDIVNSKNIDNVVIH
jgi:hypothetical protein